MSDSFSNRIKDLRNEKKMNQAEFSKLINTNQSTLSAYENGDRFPPYETLICIAQQCDVSLDWLCGLSESKSPNNKMLTYSDLIRTIMSLRDTPNVDLSFRIENHYAHKFNAIPYETVVCDINDKYILDFFQEWEDIRSVCKKSLSGEKIMKIWLKDTFERYDFPLENASTYFSFEDCSDDEPPFK